MKKILIVVLICIVGILFADEISYAAYTFPSSDTLSIRIGGEIIRTTENIYIAASIIRLIQFYEEYSQECYIDTIKAIKFADDYIINHGDYGEWITERQLENRGYKFRYRWITGTQIDFDNEITFSLEYIFIKEPTLTGFIEFLRIKIGMEK